MMAKHSLAAWLLRLVGVAELTALVPLFFPHAWMNMLHQALGLGDLPDLPIIHYLTRTECILYAAQGALLLFLAMDVTKHWCVIRFLAKLGIVFGLVVGGIDVWVGMPWYWTAPEAVGLIVLCVVLLVLTNPQPHEAPPPSSD